MMKIDEHITAEISLYYDLYVPKGIETPAPLLIAVHGYAAHKKYMMREARLIAPDHFAIVSLEAPNKFWRETKNDGFKPAFGWLTDQRTEESVALHQGFVLDVIEQLSSQGIADPENVFLYGFSQSCALNFRFAFSHNLALKGLIGVCGGIPSDMDSNSAYLPTSAEVLYLFSTNDEFYPLEKYKVFESELNKYLPAVSSVSYDAGHEITDEMREDMRIWLADNRVGG